MNSCSNCEYFIQGSPHVCNAFQVVAESISAPTECAEYQQKDEEDFRQRQQQLQQSVRRGRVTDFWEHIRGDLDRMPHQVVWDDLATRPVSGTLAVLDDAWVEHARQYAPILELTQEQIDRIGLDLSRIREASSTEYAYMENGRIERLRPRNHSCTGHEAEEFLNRIELQKEYIRCRFNVTPTHVLVGVRAQHCLWDYLRQQDIVRYCHPQTPPSLTGVIHALLNLSVIPCDIDPNHIEVVTPINKLMR